MFAGFIRIPYLCTIIAKRMEKKSYPILEEEGHIGMVCEPSARATTAFSTYDAGSATYDDDVATDEDLDDVD